MKNKLVGHDKFGSRILAYVLTMMMVFTMTPLAGLGNSYAASGGEDTRVADNTTLDGWQEYFGSDDEVFNTRYAGHVWTDKSVTTDDSAFGYAKELADNSGHIAISDDENNFLVSLSAMAASKSITGQDNKPTDTMIVLDMSSSMYKNSTVRDPGPITAMIESVNSTIKQLQELNVNNRVGVTVYYGGPDLNQAPKDSYQVWLPLDRYKHSSNKFLEAKVSGGKLDSAGVNSNVTTESGKSVKAITRATNVTAGTYMQQGILSALKQFMAADTKVPANA
ncbi:MAG: VWA domain-containing protein, partial [Firmicutes bacterium]|nr:VWA domain-containing protein [Bacillota bacterium]